MRFKLKGVAKTHKRLANGRRVTYHYAWRGGPRLPGLPGSPEFMVAYNEAIKTKVPASAESTEPVLAHVIERFRRSSEFSTKAESTRREYDRYLKLIERDFGDMPLGVLDDPSIRGDFKAWRDEFADRPRVADYAWSVLARLMSFGVDRGLFQTNQCTRGGRLYTADRSEKVWSDDTLKRLFESAPCEIVAVVTFALWTGQRQADCLTTKWDALVDGKIRVKQAKGGRNVLIPVGAPLAEIIARLPRTDAGTILTNSRGEAWTSSGFRASYRTAMARAAITDDLPRFARHGSDPHGDSGMHNPSNRGGHGSFREQCRSDFGASLSRRSHNSGRTGHSTA